jgi:enterochelin esterase-like enzyme
MPDGPNLKAGISTMRKLLCLVLVFGSWGIGQAYQDTTHYSSVFGRTKTYRIFLPADYAASTKRYPVIYYFHGYGERFDYTRGSNFDFNTVDTLVSRDSVILVRWDGRMIDSDASPYNIGDSTQVLYQTQMKDYYLEFVAHIDSTYRTLPDRNHRSLMGFSMGGYMSFFLAGNYPQMAGTAVNMVGSPEMFMGTPGHLTLYSMRYVPANLLGLHLRFHETTSDILVNLNREVYKSMQREEGLDLYYHEYPGPHQIDYPGQTVNFKEAFNYIVSNFGQALPQPGRWHHRDLSASFNKWGCTVTSNLDQPGFIDLHGVSAAGLTVCTRKWLPDGVPMPGVTINITTAPVYQPNTGYTLFKYNVPQDTAVSTTVTSDAIGRIGFTVNHEENSIGIFKSGDPADLAVLTYVVDSSRTFLPHQQAGRLKLRLLNRGNSIGRRVVVTLTTPTTGVVIASPSVTIDSIASREAVWSIDDFLVTVTGTPPADGAPFSVRFNVTMTDSLGRTWKDELDVPVFFNATAITSLSIDDGRKVGSRIFGQGNGNGVAEPSETVMLFRTFPGTMATKLYSDDPFLDRSNEQVFADAVVQTDGFISTSLVRIAANCPNGHRIRFLAEDEVKQDAGSDPIIRNVRWGTLSLTVARNDSATVVATPEMFPPGGVYADSITVNCSTATSGAQVRYTVDGSQPTGSSSLYAGPLRLGQKTVLRVGAFKNGLTSSLANSATFYIVKKNSLTTGWVNQKQNENQQLSGLQLSNQPCRGTLAFSAPFPQAAIYTLSGALVQSLGTCAGQDGTYQYVWNYGNNYCRLAGVYLLKINGAVQKIVLLK